MTCDEEGRTGSRVPAGEEVAASAACLRGRGRRPGGPASARERKEGEFGTNGARTTAAAERLTLAAAGAAAWSAMVLARG
jgi:hypothetical protein